MILLYLSPVIFAFCLKRVWVLRPQNAYMPRSDPSCSFCWVSYRNGGDDLTQICYLVCVVEQGGLEITVKGLL